MRTRCWGGCGRTLTSPGLCRWCTYRAEQIATESVEAHHEREKVTADADR